MRNQKNEAGTLLPITVMEGVAVNVLPNKEHEFLMSTKEVATGYGISEYTLRRHKMEHGSELITGKHFIIAVQIMNGKEQGVLKIPHNATLWTKRGIIRLGFFIKSERAKLFRDWAEELIIAVGDAVAPVVVNQLPAKRLINRLDRDRMIRLLSMASQISDDALRLSIVNELTGGFDYGLVQKGGDYGKV